MDPPVLSEALQMATRRRLAQAGLLRNLGRARDATLIRREDARLIIGLREGRLKPLAAEALHDANFSLGDLTAFGGPSQLVETQNESAEVGRLVVLWMLELNDHVDVVLALRGTALRATLTRVMHHHHYS